MKIKYVLIYFVLSLDSVYANERSLDSMSIVDLYKEVEAINHEYEELQKAYEDAKEREQSIENRLLTAATTAVTGFGGMELAAGVAEQRANRDAEADMRAYINTFKCSVGNKIYPIGADDIELDGANVLIDMYTEYATVSNRLQKTKTALGMRPGIESEIVPDKSNNGLYDDVSVGTGGGVYASIARAIIDPSGDDAARWAQQIEQSKTKTKLGIGLGLGGSALGLGGNMIINKDLYFDTSKDK